MAQESVLIRNEGCLLEAVLHLPHGEGTFPAVTICHPHPLYGGDMNNSVVTALTRGLEQSGFAAIRFNFRGVGRSTGDYDEGIGEQNDARAVVGYLGERSEIDPERLAIAGYSFGGAMALAAAAADDRIKAVAGISPALGSANLEMLASCQKSKLIVIGENDDFTPPQRILHFVGLLPPPKQLEIIPGVDHFWFGSERLFLPLLLDFFKAEFCEKDPS